MFLTRIIAKDLEKQFNGQLHRRWVGVVHDVQHHGGTNNFETQKTSGEQLNLKQIIVRGTDVFTGIVSAERINVAQYFLILCYSVKSVPHFEVTLMQRSF